MKPSLLAILLLFLAVVMGIPISTLALAAMPDVHNAKLSHCYDGDTCTFIITECD